ncbi:MAG: ABC transporter permease/substrate-binding protein [Sphingobium phenoxybenzoativorans]
MSEALARLPGLLAAHVQLSVAALVCALVIGLPLAVIAARRPALARVALGFASLVQTIPALALLALFYPLLLALSALIGGGIPALGFLPALLALTLYALLPILRNAVTGLAGIDPAVIEAADGMGMTPGQRLRLVEAPLALPVAMAGIRTAAVWTIGAATLATTVGQPCLGDLIFAGLQTQDWPLVLTGCAAAASLALLADGLLGAAEWGVRTRRRWPVWSGLAVLACGLLLSLAPLARSHGPVVTIGAKNFSEQFILARLIGNRLEAAGYQVRYREGLGSAVIFKALEAGDIDIYVDYAGTIWTNEMRRSDVPSRGRMVADIGAWMKGGGKGALIGPLGFENSYAFAMRATDQRRLGIRTLGELAARSPALRLGTDIEFLERPEWRMVKAAYSMRFAEARPFQPTMMYNALASGRVDVITAFSSDGRIASDGLVTLADVKGAIPSYDALLLASRARAGDERFIAALAPLIDHVPVALMREANYRVDRPDAKESPAQAAAWLDSRIGG